MTDCLSVMTKINRLVAQLPESGRRIVQRAYDCEIVDENECRWAEDGECACVKCHQEAKDHDADSRYRQSIGD